MKKALIVSLGLLGVGLGSVAQARGLTASERKSAQNLGQQIAYVQNRFEDLGYSSNSHELGAGMLAQGQREGSGIRLDSGVEYKIVGVCDSNCRDLDLFLYDENGNQVSRDASNDYLPIVTVTPRWDGRFLLRASMARCNKAKCGYAVRVFSR